MKRLIAVVLVVLLVGSLVFGVWQYAQNQHLAAENAQLRHQLDAQATELRQAEDALNETRNQLAEQQARVTQLEQQVSNYTTQIRQLQLQLARRGYTPIALTFVWNPDLVEPPFNTTELPSLINQVVQEMNNDSDTWQPAKIYFWIRYEGPEQFMPTTGDCDITNPSFPHWGDQAWNLYSGSDIPVGVFSDLKVAAGTTEAVEACEGTHGGQYVISLRWLWLQVDRSLLLTHEMMHVLGFSDEEIDALNPSWNGFILKFPVAWIGRIKDAAQQIQMAPPSEF